MCFNISELDWNFNQSNFFYSNIKPNMFIARTVTEKCGLKLFLQNIFTKLRNMRTRNAQKISTPFRKYIEFESFWGWASIQLPYDGTNQPPNSSLTLDPPARKHVNFYQSKDIVSKSCRCRSQMKVGGLESKSLPFPKDSTTQMLVRFTKQSRFGGSQQV
jgi:hypothetical protein